MRADALDDRHGLAKHAGDERRRGLAERRAPARPGPAATRGRRRARPRSRSRRRAPPAAARGGRRRPGRPPTERAARPSQATGRARVPGGDPSRADPRPRTAGVPRGAGRGCSRASRGPWPARSRLRRPAPAPSTRASPRARRTPARSSRRATSRARPKSVTTTRPVPRSTSTLDGVRSRWTTPRACACASAAATGAQSRRASSQPSVRPPTTRVQAVALDELEDEHRLPAVLEDVVEPDDVRVLEPGECRGLALEARAELLVVGDPGMQHLERDLAPEPLVVGTPDDAHATATELVAQAIAVRDDVLGVLHVTPPGVAGRRSDASRFWFGFRKRGSWAVVDSPRADVRPVRAGESRRVRVLPRVRGSSRGRARTRGAEGRHGAVLRPDGVDGDRGANRSGGASRAHEPVLRDGAHRARAPRRHGREVRRRRGDGGVRDPGRERGRCVARRARSGRAARRRPRARPRGADRRQHRRRRRGRGRHARHRRRGERRRAARAGGRSGRDPARRGHASASFGTQSAASPCSSR